MMFLMSAAVQLWHCQYVAAGLINERWGKLAGDILSQQQQQQQLSTYLASFVHLGVDNVLSLVGTGASTEGEEEWHHLSRQACCQLLCDVQCLTCQACQQPLANLELL